MPLASITDPIVEVAVEVVAAGIAVGAVYLFVRWRRQPPAIDSATDTAPDAT